MTSYNQFVINMNSKLGDYNSKEKVIYMLRHPVHLKQCGGNLQMLADYILMECK